MKSLVIAMASFTAMISTVESHGAIQIGTGSFTAAVYADGPGTTEKSFNLLDLSDSTPETITTTNGGSLSETTATSTTSNGETVISFDFSQQRDGNYLSGAQTYSLIYLTPTEDVIYSITGHYNVQHTGAASRAMLSLNLDEILPSTQLVNLFANGQESRSTANEFFILGGEGGDHANTLSGASTGLLIKGRNYQLQFQASMEQWPTFTDGGATATGNITFSFASPSAVPEPTQLAVWLALGLCSAVFHRLRGRSTPLPNCRFCQTADASGIVECRR